MANSQNRKTKRSLGTSDREIEHRSPRQEVIQNFLNDTVGVISVVLLMVLIVCALVGPSISPYGIEEPNYNAINQPPTIEHPGGTDELGRDVLTRTLSGIWTSAIIASTVVFIAGFVGVLVGTVAGYTMKTWLDEMLMRGMDILLSFPLIVLGVAVMGFLGTGTTTVGGLQITNFQKLVIVVGLALSPRLARVSRGAVMQQRNMDYVKVARLEGAGSFAIILGEILVNAIAPMIILMSFLAGAAVIITAGLSFIGLGVQPPQPSLGRMVSSGYGRLLSGQWWLVVVPGVALALFVLALNLVGDALRDALDPEMGLEKY